ncbi:cytochrome C [Loktanella sp. IMCC34160]|uniref:c-type cytochrome n=1 Tax=Loktanella sp. IMCC34160 TaxID=2510646 RepID=UPI00101BE267|nr:cytochrome C [Loktanella sp. IMCC34160]RYG89941.1 cytochrome C [Loktanella sp. IMCC34160]
MKTAILMTSVALACVLSIGAMAQDAGDPVNGEDLFRNCLACHELKSDSGERIRRGGRAGPNLYGVIGRPAGGLEGYRYSDGLSALNASGLVWDEENLAHFMSNPNGFLEEALGEGHISKMPFAFPTGAADIAAYLAQVGQSGS